MHILLIGSYELGRQPFGLASPAAWLRQAGFDVTCQDLSRQRLDSELVRQAELVCLYVPMHTATRIAAAVAPRVRALNPETTLCFYGLYAPLNAELLRQLGAQALIGGEFEGPLVALAEQVQAGKRIDPEPQVNLAAQRFLVPDRSDLPPLAGYAGLLRSDGERLLVGNTEASRGCKYHCRHCPIVPVYNGRFRIVEPEVVLADIRQQVAAGARHISFGDPDFFNGPTHAERIVTALHAEFAEISYDVTIKVEHLLRHSERLPLLRDTGCAFVTSAVESLDDVMLAELDKGHTRADLFAAAERMRDVGLALSPTFIPFSPWTTLEGYRELLQTLDALGLVEQTAPIQLAIRLLITGDSPLLELPIIQEHAGPFDPVALAHPWVHSDPRVDNLAEQAMALIEAQNEGGASRRQIFSRLCELAGVELATSDVLPGPPRSTIPYLDEPWYC